jgi:hypothetical protein
MDRLSEDQLRARIKLGMAKLRVLQNQLKDSRSGASDDKVRMYIEKLLDKIIKTKVVKEEDTPYEDMGDPREYLAQWFANSMNTRMLYVIKKAYDRGFPMSRIVSAFKKITESDEENYDEMREWLDKRSVEKLETVFKKILAESVA